MLEDIAQWSRIASVFIVLAQGVLVWILWSLRKQYVSRDHCETQCQKHAEKRAAIEQRQARLEQTQANAPTGREMSAIKDQLGDMAGDIKALRVTTEAQSDAMKRIERPLNLLLEHEIHGGRK